MEMCRISNCDTDPIAICLHCQELLCVEHLLRHHQDLIHQADIYCDEYNQLTEQMENLSFDEQFRLAKEELNEWMNDQMKQLAQVYEDKLFRLKQAEFDMKEKVQRFQQNQRMKMQLFNAHSNKQASFEELYRMKQTIDQLREDILQFKVNHHSPILLNDDSNITVQWDEDQTSQSFDSIGDMSLSELNKPSASQLNVDAKPFEYIPNEESFTALSSFRQKNFFLVDSSIDLLLSDH